MKIKFILFMLFFRSFCSDVFVQDNMLRFSDGSSLNIDSDIDSFSLKRWRDLLKENNSELYLIKVDSERGLFFHELSQFLDHYKRYDTDFFNKGKIENFSIYKITSSGKKIQIGSFYDGCFDSLSSLYFGLDSVKQKVILKYLKSSKSLNSKIALVKLYQKGSVNLNLKELCDSLLLASNQYKNMQSVEGIVYWVLLKFKESNLSFNSEFINRLLDEVQSGRDVESLKLYLQELKKSSDLSDPLDSSLLSFFSGFVSYVSKDNNEAIVNFKICIISASSRFY